MDDFARLIETHYETFDTEGRGMLPLTKVYWPADRESLNSNTMQNRTKTSSRLVTLHAEFKPDGDPRDKIGSLSSSTHPSPESFQAAKRDCLQISTLRVFV